MTVDLDSEEVVLYDAAVSDNYPCGGGPWRLVTDTVMGGISAGELTRARCDHRACLRMRGQVSLENNGGFVQMALTLAHHGTRDLRPYTGITLEVRGNNADYNVHLRTEDISRPWQSYRAPFFAKECWQVVRIPFTAFSPHRIDKSLDLSRVTRLGLVAIGREFRVDLCLARLAIYKNQAIFTKSFAD